MGVLNTDLGFNLTTHDPINSTPYNVGVTTIGPPNPPPSTDYFLLLDGTNFLLLDGEDLLLL